MKGFTIDHPEKYPCGIGLHVHDPLYRLGFWLMRRLSWPLRNRWTLQMITRLIKWRSSAIGLDATLEAMEQEWLSRNAGW